MGRPDRGRGGEDRPLTKSLRAYGAPASVSKLGRASLKKETKQGNCDLHKIRDTTAGPGRTNPLGLNASYEEACQWLEKASALGSGEASEVLAQLITRMKANGHTTSYSAADATRLHALARSQGFDVPAIRLQCFQLISGQKGLTVATRTSIGTDNPSSFSEQELSSLRRSGVAGTLQFGSRSEPGSGDPALLTRPELPITHVRVILDHPPKDKILLPLPARRDVIYVQRGEEFLAFPASGANLPRHILIETESYNASQVRVSVQGIGGGYSGPGCGSFR